MRRRDFLSTALALPPLQDQPWNVLLVTWDQLRADHLGVAGHPVVKTPAVDRLASEGVRFTHHFVQCPQCVPSRMSLHTGRYPHTHRTVTNAYRIPAEERTLAHLLAERGYRTACVGERPFAPRDDLAGFQEVVASGKDHEEHLRSFGWTGSRLAEFRERQKRDFQAVAAPWPLEADETPFFAERAARFLKQKQDRPFYLHLSLRHPHHPFDPPEPYASRYRDARFPASHVRPGEFDTKPPAQAKALRASVGFDLTTMTPADVQRVKALYAGMVSLADAATGRVLDALREAGLDQRTVVVFLADHGEMLCDHGLLFKGGYMYDEVLRTPLVVRAPGLAPRESDDLVETVDVLPGILQLLGLPVPAAVQGRPLLQSRKSAVFSEFPTIKCVRTGQWKLVHYPRQKYGELYNLVQDPQEFENLWGRPEAAAGQARLQAMLSDWLIETEDPRHAPIRDLESK